MFSQQIRNPDAMNFGSRSSFLNRPTEPAYMEKANTESRKRTSSLLGTGSPPSPPPYNPSNKIDWKCRRFTLGTNRVFPTPAEDEIE